VFPKEVQRTWEEKLGMRESLVFSWDLSDQISQVSQFIEKSQSTRRSTTLY
jgi:hypothetical protein